MRQYLVGVDIGGTTIKMGLFDLNGKLLDKWEIPTNTQEEGKAILPDIAKSIKSKTELSTVAGVGFGVPGPVNNNVVINGVNINWPRKDVKEEFLDLIQDNEIDIRVSNDANVAAAGEILAGNAIGHQNIAFITLGTGVGGGIVIDGKVIDGRNGVAGEIGHIVVDHKYKFRCNCGKSGCLETVASATGIARIARYNLDHSEESSLLRQFDSLNAKKVIDAAKQGDKLAYQSFTESAKYLATICAEITHVINPELFIFGGGVSNAGDYLIKEVEKYYYDLVKPFITKMDFAIASLTNDAGIYGACYLVKK